MSVCFGKSLGFYLRKASETLYEYPSNQFGCSSVDYSILLMDVLVLVIYEKRKHELLWYSIDEIGLLCPHLEELSIINARAAIGSSSGSSAISSLQTINSSTQNHTSKLKPTKPFTKLKLGMYL